MVILELRGSQGRRLRSRFVQKDRSGEKFIIDAPGLQTHFIPIHKQTKYLGVVISYGPFEDASLQHRLTLMKVGFNRLRRWLTGKHCLNIHQRLKLWNTCVYPIFSYGLFAMGLTPKGIRTAITQITIMLRKLAHDHPSLTGRNNQAAFQHSRLPHPAQLLHGTAESLLRTVVNREQIVLPQDLVRTVTWTHLPILQQQLHQLQATSSLEPFLHVSPEAHKPNQFLQCQQCDFCTDDVSAFRRHCTHMHAYPMYRTRYVEVMNHAEHGLPQCRHCHTPFTTWRMFYSHVERGCQALVIGPSACSLETSHSGTGQTAPLTMQPQPQFAAMRGVRLITDSELQILRQQDFGPRLLHIVSERHWIQVRHEQTACHYLSRHCIICSYQFSRCQELHQHYRIHHADLWEHVPEKAIQLTNLHCTESPCECCGSMFRTHMCPTWTQVAVLLVNGAGRTASDMDDIHQLTCRCEVCLEVFPDSGSLVRHLQEAHALQGLSFNASRDSLDNSTACSHCGQIFSTAGELKSHIVQGRCAFFNPQATAETLPVDPRWQSACIEGQFHEIMRPPQTRLHLTLVCQACGRRYQRAADLSLHLQTAHARLWRRSQRLTLLMVDAFYHIKCYCNSALNTQRLQHICIPFRQLAMTFHRMDQEPFAPFVITDEMLTATISSKLPAQEKHRLEHLLAQRLFTTLWQDMEILTTLSCHCIFCGARMATSDLAVHLHQEHLCQQEAVLFYLEQLLPVAHALNTEDFRCQLCRLIYNLPATQRPDETLAEREALSRSHLSGSCPVLLQLARLFASFLLPHGPGGSRSIGTDDGHIRSFGAFTKADGSRPEIGPGSSGHQEAPQSRQRTARSTRNTRRSAGTTAHTSAAAHPDPAGGETRPRIAKSPTYGSIHTFFEPRAAGGTSHPAGGDQSMETTAGEKAPSSGTASATAPHDCLATGAPIQDWEDSGGKGDGQAASNVGREGPHLGGQELPISSLGSAGPEACLGSKSCDQLSQDASAFGGASGDDAGQGSDHQIPRSESTHGDSEGHPVAIAAESTHRSSIRIASLLGPQLGVDGGGSIDEATYIDADTLGHQSSTHGAATQGPGKRQRKDQDPVATLSDETHADLIKGLCGLCLTNDRNWCYGNSTLHCFGCW